MLFVAALLVVAALSTPTLASAHSFLIRSDPAAGARLAQSPPLMTMYFSEAFVAGSEHVSVTRSGGAALTLQAPQAKGSVIRQVLPPHLRGVYVVSWRVLSDDGHISLGEFAVAVGSAAALPALGAGSSGTTPLSGVAASWLFFVGLALALGGIVSGRLFWRGSAALASVGRLPVLAGVMLALLGELWTLVLLAGARAGGGFGTGLSRHALRLVISTRPGELTLAVLIGLAVALFFVCVRPLRLVAVVPLVAAAVETSARGHSGTSGDWWAFAADVVHLLGAALWVGALALLVLVAARARDHAAALVTGARAYSRLALPTVLVVLASGVVTAIPEFRSFSEIVSTGYGRVLLIKAGLIAAALVLALVSRLRALGANPHPHVGFLRRATAVEALTVAGVLVAVSVLVNSAPPRTEAAAAALPQLGPPPLQGAAVQLADLAGQLVVGLAATGRELRFTVLPPEGEPTGSLKLTASADPPSGKPVDLFPRSCGGGCFTIRYRLRHGATRISAHLSSSIWKGGDVSFRLTAPIPAQVPALLARVSQTMRKLPSLSLTEQVSSGPGARAAPAAYTLSGKQFMQSEVFGGGGSDVREIARAHGLRELTFVVPGSNIWYRLWIDSHNRLQRELIVDPGHRITRTFSYRGSPPPKQSSAPYGVSGVPGSPRPPNAPLVLAQEAGDMAVMVAFRPVGGRLLLTATVIGGDGLGAAGVDVRFSLTTTAGTSSATAANCGDGCHRALLTPRGQPRTLELDLQHPGKATQRLQFALPAQWPPPPATTIARRATEVFRHLHTLVIDERLASSLTNFVVTTWRLEAPDRLSYVIHGGGPQAVVVGVRRWDRATAAARWQESSSTVLPQPTPPWITAPAHAALLGSTTIAGHPVWLISFLEPSTPAWFKLAIDKKTMRTLELHMVAPAHFMHHLYSGFNSGFTITPPRTR